MIRFGRIWIFFELKKNRYEDVFALKLLNYRYDTIFVKLNVSHAYVKYI